MRKYIVPLLGYLLASIYFSGCTYHGNLQEDFYTRTNANKLQLKGYLLFDSNLEQAHYKRENIHFLHSAEINTSPGLKSAMAKAFSNVFEEVYTSNVLIEDNLNNADVLIYPKIEVRDNVMFMSVALKSLKTDEVLGRYESSGNLDFGKPGSVIALKVLGDITLCALCPITIPATTYILGNKTQSSLEERLSDCLNNITEEIRNDRMMVKKVKGERE